MMTILFAMITVAMLGAATSPASYTVLLLSALLIMTLLSHPQLLPTLSIHSSLFMTDNLSWSLVCLGLLVSALMVVSEPNPELTGPAFRAVVISMFLTILSVFTVKSFIAFYIMFECSLLPITLMVMGWGYQPERLPASLAMMIYTVMGSLPLLMFIVYCSHAGLSSMTLLTTCMASAKFPNLLLVMAMAGFLVKFPLYGVHLWLPKAHVEAPVFGSMILAALLLKLGGYGMWRLLVVCPWASFSELLQAFAMLGGGLIALVCLRQLDMKVMIAYSSVSHMSFAIASLLSVSPLALAGSLMMMVAHGISSSGMFFGANSLYQATHSRNMLLTSGMLASAPLVCSLWFCMCILNMAAPPSFNLLAEIWCVQLFSSLEFALLLSFSLSSFLAAAYSLILYSSPIQGQPGLGLHPGHIFTPVSLLVFCVHAVWGVSVVLIFL